MTDPKPSTNDILSKIRAKNAAAAALAESAPADSPSPVEPQTPAAPKGTSDILAAARAAAKPADAPKGTADILASIKKPAAPAAPAAGGAAPKSPADIMAAIRAKAGTAPAAETVAAVPVKAALAAEKVAAAVTPGMSAAEMIRAARSASGGVPTPPKVALPSKPLAGKGPTVASKAAAADVTRRSALGDVMAL